jgi:hypothetical protein
MYALCLTLIGCLITDVKFFSVAPLCIGKKKENVVHPTDATKYIACTTEEKPEVMECPESLIYNVEIDACETVKKPELICERESPCLNGGQCHQNGPSSFKCTCTAAWTGERCETAVSSCAADPCGAGNECHSLKTVDYPQDFVCLCNQRQSYGLSCAESE